MGRPKDVEKRKDVKDSQTIEQLTELVKSQSIMIQSLVSKIELGNNPKTLADELKNVGIVRTEDLARLLENININGSSIIDEPDRPKLDDFYINPSKDMAVSYSNIEDSPKDSTVVTEDLDDKAKKLKEILNKRSK